MLQNFRSRCFLAPITFNVEAMIPELWLSCCGTILGHWLSFQLSRFSIAPGDLDDTSKGMCRKLLIPRMRRKGSTPGFATTS